MPDSRDFSRLCSVASSDKVLNLSRAMPRTGIAPQRTDQPMFQHPVLNTAVYVKDRLGLAERLALPALHSIGTRIIFPTPDGLDRPPHTALMEEERFSDRLIYILRGTPAPGPGDLRILEMLARMPSLNPLLIQDMVRRMGRETSAGYFRRASDYPESFRRFAKAELAEFSRMAVTDEITEDHLARGFIDKLLSPCPAERMEPLRIALRLDPDTFSVGLHAWCGILFYKWRLIEIEEQIQEAVRRVYAIAPIGNAVERAGILVMQRRVTAGLRHAIQACKQQLSIRDRHMRSVTRMQHGGAFVRMLRQAPESFTPLAYQVDSLAKIIRIVNFRCHPARATRIVSHEAVAVLTEIENIMAANDREVEIRARYALARSVRDLDAESQTSEAAERFWNPARWLADMRR